MATSEQEIIDVDNGDEDTPAVDVEMAGADTIEGESVPAATEEPEDVTAIEDIKPSRVTFVEYVHQC